LVALVVAALVLGACGKDDQKNGVQAAQKRVDSKQKALTDAQTKFDASKATFCDKTKTYIASIDRYGKVFDNKAATVGDVKTAGADLAKPRESVQSAAQGVVSARDEVAKAEKELADAQAALADAKASASGAPTTTTTVNTGTTTTTAPLLPSTAVDRVKKAESDLASASKGITDQTPILQATAEFNSAAFALEVSWLAVYNDAGCLTDEQQKEAQNAVQDYTVKLQTALQTAGYYSGPIDGVYGPTTVAAVKQVQTANGLPVTGLVDQATAAALSSAVAAKGGAVATQALAHTAAVQSTLKLAGYWTGPVDGKWTPELTTALMTFQTALGVPATGAVDAATLAALQETIANATSSSTTTSTSTSEPSGSTTSTSTG
jgi:peptidoglycan hydrolase-like protein with peptidoglycan-binding domain